MPLYRPSELKEFLILNGINPKKALSQNFLIDGNVLKKIVDISKIEHNEVVLEIGPGPGALTEQLIEAKAQVIAVEKDEELFRLLPRLDESNKQLHLYNDDIMRFPIEETLLSFLEQGKKAKVIANLPYHLTTPILEKIMPMNHVFSKVIVMVQDEVARRFAAQPGSSEYGSFTVFLNYYSNPRYAFQVKRNSFFPAPKIDSAIVVLDLHPPLKVSDEQKFFEFTRRAFQTRRKMLRKSLSELYPKELITKILEDLSINPLIRPEELSIHSFIEIFELIYPHRID